MKTITLKKPGEFMQSDTAYPRVPGSQKVLVRIKSIGVCGTDLHAYRGKQPFFSYPRILGHELGVEVVDCGENVSFRKGQYCAVEPYLYCETCTACRKGKTNCCENLEVLGVHVDGGMREQMIVPAKILHASDKLVPEQLALVETLGIGRHAVERAAIEKNDAVLVLGAGPIGLSVVQFAQLYDVPLVVADLDEGRLQFCQNNMQVTDVLNAREKDFISLLKNALGGDLPSIIFDATGNPDSMHQAIDYLAPGSKLVFVGLFLGDYTFHDPLFHKKEVTLMSSRNSTGKDFQNIIHLMEKGSVNTTPWITHHLGLDDIVDGFASLLNPSEGVVKAMINV